MAGHREFESTIEQLGLRIDDLGGLERIPIAPDCAALQAKTANAARWIIEDAADDLLRDVFVPLPGAEPTPSGEPNAESTGRLPDLPERLFRSQQATSDGDDTETEPE